MVCGDCQMGGRMLRRREQGLTEDPVVALEVVKNCHDSCRGGTWCDCAHQLEGPGVNWDLVRKLQESNN
jgi:hypothetical protein